MLILVTESRSELCHRDASLEISELSEQIFAIAGFSANYLNVYDRLIQKSCEKNRMSGGTHRPILITRRRIGYAVHMMSENYCQWRNVVAYYENSASRRLEKNYFAAESARNLRSRPFRHFSMSPKYGVRLENRFFVAQTIEPLSGIAEILGLRVTFDSDSAVGRQPSRPLV